MNKYTIALVAVVLAVAAVGAWTAHHLLAEGRITPNDEFFVVSIAPAPEIAVGSWNLTVDGLVDHPVNLTYEDLQAIPVNETERLKCVDGPTGTAVWTGVPVHDVLARAGVSPGAKEVVFHGADGYTSSLPLDYLARDDVLLAWGMNGEPLPRDQGYPLRLVAPDKYGYKWVKFVYRLEVIDHDYRGYWESRGWSQSADASVAAGWGWHAALLSVVAVLGGLAYVSGSKLSPSPNFWSDLPDRFGKGLHNVASKGFGLVAVPTLVYWLVVVERERGSLPVTLHGVLGVASLVIMVIGGIASGPLALGREGARPAHGYALRISYLLFLAAILTGLMRI